MPPNFIPLALVITSNSIKITKVLTVSSKIYNLQVMTTYQPHETENETQLSIMHLMLFSEINRESHLGLLLHI